MHAEVVAEQPFFAERMFVEEEHCHDTKNSVFPGLKQQLAGSFPVFLCTEIEGEPFIPGKIEMINGSCEYVCCVA